MEEDDVHDSMVRKRPPRKQREAAMGAKDSGNREAPQGILDLLINVDQAVTAQLGLSATPSSPLGHLRPVMKVLEYSCHGVPWLSATILGLFFTHKAHVQEILLNLLIGMYQTKQDVAVAQK